MNHPSLTITTWAKLITKYSWSSRLGDMLHLGTIDYGSHIITPEWTMEDLFSEPLVPTAYVMENDAVYCEWCHTARNEDRGHNHMDNDPSYWISATMPWQEAHECDCCGTRDGINHEEEDNLSTEDIREALNARPGA